MHLGLLSGWGRTALLIIGDEGGEVPSIAHVGCANSIAAPNVLISKECIGFAHTTGVA